MNFKALIIAILFAFASVFCFAQNTLVDYKLIHVNSTPKEVNPKLQMQLDKEKTKLSRKTNVVIGYCPETMESYVPQSPLSNFLTDLLVEFSNDYCSKRQLDSVDFSLLNFGGIRASLPAGDVTLGHFYEISPFENSLVIVNIKGSELTKVLRRFKIKTAEAISNDIEMVYLGDYVHKIYLHGQKIDNDRIYRFATLDFIVTGGDGILKGIQLESTYYTKLVMRDIYINYVKKMTDSGKEVSGKIDKRVFVLPQDAKL